LRNTDSLTNRQRAVVVMGSWLTAKEQMAATYARRLADAGHRAFIFDFTGFGESHGDPRQTEISARKIADIAAAVQFLRTLAFVDPSRIGCLAVCASAQYTLQALAEGVPVRSFASVAGWFHDPSSIAPGSVSRDVVPPRIQEMVGTWDVKQIAIRLIDQSG
jgi:uncharacterized protein